MTDTEQDLNKIIVRLTILCARAETWEHNALFADNEAKLWYLQEALEDARRLVLDIRCSWRGAVEDAKGHIGAVHP
jgi:hypothetical protein